MAKTKNKPLEITVNGGNVIQWPVDGQIIKNFGEDNNNGVDIAVADNTPVRSATDGTVLFAGENDEFGHVVIIKQNDATYTVYGYVDDIKVQKGDTITRDQEIAVAGVTGDGGPLFHFEIRQGLPDPVPVDPVEMLGEIAPIIKPAEISNFSDYKVKDGDGSLWNIAKEHYGLTKPADIMRAVTAIANANGMTEGTMANDIKVGQPLKLPDSPNPDSSAKPLNWVALDEETADRKKGLRGTFTPAASGKEIVMPAPAIIAHVSTPAP